MPAGTPHSRRRFLRHTAGAVLAAPFVARGATAAVFEFGLAADAQYADIAAAGTRFYREGRPRLAAAADHFSTRGVAFAVHLGDLIDRAWPSFDPMLAALGTGRLAWHHVLGNHDFDVLDAEKPRVPARLGFAAARYRAVSRHGFRFVFLDTNDVSLYAHPAGSAPRTEAESRLAAARAAKLASAKTWNGAVGSAQLAWFDAECRAAAAARERVIVFAHHPVYPENPHNAWNAADVLATIDRHRHVVAWLNGHNHAGAFAARDGVPFLTLRGMVETADTTAFAVAAVHADRLVLTGHGREPSRELVFRS